MLQFVICMYKQIKCIYTYIYHMLYRILEVYLKLILAVLHSRAARKLEMTTVQPKRWKRGTGSMNLALQLFGAHRNPSVEVPSI